MYFSFLFSHLLCSFCLFVSVPFPHHSVLLTINYSMNNCVTVSQFVLSVLLSLRNFNSYFSFNISLFFSPSFSLLFLSSHSFSSFNWVSFQWNRFHHFILLQEWMVTREKRSSSNFYSTQNVSFSLFPFEFLNEQKEREECHFQSSSSNRNLK